MAITEAKGLSADALVREALDNILADVTRLKPAKGAEPLLTRPMVSSRRDPKNVL
jgi:hypothetical protein